jgi:hypothetical protein
MGFADEKFHFFNCKDLIDFRTYQLDDFDTLNAAIGVAVGSYFIFTTYNPLNIFDGEPLHGLSSLCCALGFLFYLVFSFERFVEFCIPEDKCILCRIFHFISKSPWLQLAGPDGVAFLGAVGMGIGLYARVLNGHCDENADYWDIGRCNYMTGLTAAPTDYVVYMTLLPLYLQQILRGLSFRMAVITCGISTFSVAVSIMQATKAIDLGTLGCSLRVLLMLYSYEKMSRVIFVKNRTLAAANLANKAHMVFKQKSEQLRITEKNKYELEIRAFKAEEESRLLESERKQMVALLGNVAHDLKTPLQAFLMDLESLKTAVETSRSKKTRAVSSDAYCMFHSDFTA